MATDETPDLQEAATRALRHPATLDKTIPFDRGRVEIWRSTRRRPSQIAAYYVDQDGKVLRLGTSWHRFEAFLARARPDFGDVPLISSLVRVAAPGRRVLATEEYLVPEAYRGTPWQPRHDAEGRLVASCHEIAEGRWEEIVLDPEGKVTLTEIGPAPTIGLR